MTSAYITIDTEYNSSLAARRRPASRQENYARTIACETPDGAVGIHYQIRQFNSYGLKAVFFVDPMAGLVMGQESVDDVVRPILEGGHDVQLHIHTEWLALAGESSPVPLRPDGSGRNIADFALDEQRVIIEVARDMLIAAGAPAPIAFRAGNYGANDDTLRALAQAGIAYDTSFTPGIEGGDCAITLTAANRRPVRHHGVIEVPTGCIENFGGQLRHAQVTAISAREMLGALKHAAASDIDNFTMVSHSFELMCRQRRKTNKVVKRRFEQLCAGIAALDGVRTATYSDNPPVISKPMPEPRPVLPLNPLLAGQRLAEQALSNMLYGA